MSVLILEKDNQSTKTEKYNLVEHVQILSTDNGLNCSFSSQEWSVAAGIAPGTGLMAELPSITAITV